MTTMTDRVPPHSQEAEESVLGAVLLSPESALFVCESIEATDFYVPAHQVIFEAVRRLHDAGKPIDAVTLSDDLRRAGELDKVGGTSYLTRLVDVVPSTTNLDHYIGIVRENAYRRRLIRVGHELATRAGDLDLDPDSLEALTSTLGQMRQPTTGEPSGVYLTRASDLTPELVEWFDDSLIPLRVVTLVTGVDGVGKSTILYTKAARATRGNLPGAFHGAPVDVVIASSEDHPESVILPRLIAAGADLDHCHIVKVRRDGLDGEMSLPDDLPAVADRVRDVAARLLIVDPLIAYMPLNIDGHKAQHIRSVLAPLARLAEEQRLAVAAVVHFNGSASTDVRSRISGSKALRDAARSVLVCGEDPDDEARFLLVQDKNSFGPKPTTGRAYRIESAEIEHHGHTFPTSRVVWLGEVPITSRALLAGPSAAEDRSERDIAKEVILSELKGRDLRWADLLELMKDQGVTEITARRARDDLKKDRRIDLLTAGWLWTLITPDDQGSDDQGSKPPLTRGNGTANADLDHSLDSDQGHGSEATGEPLPDPMETATRNLLDAGLDFEETP